MWIASLLLLGLSLLTSIAAAQGPSLTRGPYLQATTRDSVIVVWQTDVAGDSVVEYGETGYTQTASDSTPVTTHVITLTGLAAATTYQYQIKTGGTLLYQSTLATVPDPGAAFDFTVIGDSGNGSFGQMAVALQLEALDPDFLLHTGDVIYPLGQASGYNPYFFTPYHYLVDRAPVFPSLGNHDYATANGQPYLDAFYLPASSPGGERYYSFDWGDAHFVALDSNWGFTVNTSMLDWLESDLAASTAEWKFVFFHHALYTTGPHRNDPTLPILRDALGPVLSKYKVDIVFNGHDHAYERSRPLNGVIYVVTGGGGGDLYSVGTSGDIVFSASVYHAVQVQIDGCLLSLRAIDISGTTFDQIVLTKCPRIYLPALMKN